MFRIHLSKLIYRALSICFYISIIIIVFIGVGKTMAYINTGANRNLMLHTKIYETIHYQPTINWTLNNNKGRIVSSTVLKSIERDYLNSWYVKQIALHKNTNKGLKDYYTKSALSTLEKNIAYNKTNHISIKSTTLSHHPSIDFFSEDGQLVLITDSNITEEKNIYNHKKLILHSSEVNTYQFLLLLEDGFWRTRQVLKIAPSKIKTYNSPKISINKNIKGINYYPQDTPWDMFGEEFLATTIDTDFKLIKNIGLNTIRIFIQYKDFGASEVQQKKLNKLTQVLDIAEKYDLKTIVTLFDFYGDYSIMDWTLNNKHATSIVTHLKNHPALYAWDIKNEPNLDFNTRGKQRVLDWLTQMIHHIKFLDQKHPITIGWSNTQSADLLANEVDFVSFHYYEDLENLATAYQKLKTVIPTKEIVLGEYGLSNYKGLWNPFGNNEKEQANYHRKFQEIAKKQNIPFISWTLYDFKKIPKEVVGKLPWRKNNQKHFGFIDQNGKRKKSFEFIIKP